MKTHELNSRLRRKFQPEEWALFFEVPRATGGGARSMDALAVNLWRSRGLLWHGFEVKVSRGDWLRELKDPAKAETFIPLVDTWSIVAPRGIVLAEELPPGWGLLEPHAAGLRYARTPEQRVGAAPGEHRAFLAAVLRRAHQMVTSETEAALAERQDEASAELAELRAFKRDNAGLRRVYDAVRRFEDASGISVMHMGEWQAGRIGGFIKDCLDQSISLREGIERHLTRSLATSQRETERIEAALAALRGAGDPEQPE